MPQSSVELAGRELLIVDEALVGEQASGELLARHFEREERNGLVGRLCDVQRDVQRERRLAHAGARRDQQQVGFVQAVDLPIEVMQAGGETGNVAARFGQLLQAVVDIQQDLSNVLEAVARIFLAERINFLL